MKRKATKEKSLSQALAKDLATVCQKEGDMTFEDIVKSFRIIERSHLARVTDNQFLALETRRRVAASSLCCRLQRPTVGRVA